jgi:hypothetical protein
MLVYAAITGSAGATLGPVLSSTAAITLAGNKICSYCRATIDPSFSSESCCKLEEGSCGLLPVNMRTAGRYAVLSNSATTMAYLTEFNGDFGQYPGAAITSDGVPVFHGQQDVADEEAAQAQADNLLARIDAGGRPASVGPQFPVIPASGALAGMTLIPGVYDAVGALVLAGVLTFDAQDDPNAVWIIRAQGALSTAAASDMVMIGGCPANIFFVLGGAATFGNCLLFTVYSLAIHWLRCLTRALFVFNFVSLFTVYSVHALSVHCLFTFNNKLLLLQVQAPPRSGPIWS